MFAGKDYLYRFYKQWINVVCIYIFICMYTCIYIYKHMTNIYIYMYTRTMVLYRKASFFQIFKYLACMFRCIFCSCTFSCLAGPLFGNEKTRCDVCPFHRDVFLFLEGGNRVLFSSSLFKWWPCILGLHALNQLYNMADECFNVIVQYEGSTHPDTSPKMSIQNHAPRICDFF